MIGLASKDTSWNNILNHIDLFEDKYDENLKCFEMDIDVTYLKSKDFNECFKYYMKNLLICY